MFNANFSSLGWIYIVLLVFHGWESAVLGENHDHLARKLPSQSIKIVIKAPATYWVWTQSLIINRLLEIALDKLLNIPLSHWDSVWIFCLSIKKILNWFNLMKIWTTHVLFFIFFSWFYVTSIKNDTLWFFLTNNIEEQYRTDKI